MEVLNLFTRTVWILFTAWSIVHTASGAQPGKFRPSRRLAWGLFGSTVVFLAGQWICLLPMPEAKLVGDTLVKVGAANAVPLAALYGWLLWRHNRDEKRGALKSTV